MVGPAENCHVKQTMVQPAYANLTTSGRWVVWGALLAGFAIVMGAFGAHAMEDYLSNFANGERRIDVWDTAAHYHLVHAVGLILLGVVPTKKPKLMNVAGWLLLAGIVIFSGLLYLYAYTGLRIIGAFVPIGGGCMIAGWITMAMGGCGGGTINGQCSE